ncbi:MAG: hypothetical protein Q9178_004731 [Gyalolechia marmorata]
MAQDELARQWRAYEGFAREEFGTWADHCRQYPEDWRLLWRILAEQRDRQMMWRLWREPYVVPTDPGTPRYGGRISPEVPGHDSVAADLASEAVGEPWSQCKALQAAMKTCEAKEAQFSQARGEICDK